MSAVSFPLPAQAASKVTLTPRKKVVAASAGAAFGSAVGAIGAWLLGLLLDRVGIAVPSDVKSSVIVVIATVVTMLAGYYTPPGASETAITGQDGSVRSALQGPETPAVASPGVRDMPDPVATTR